MKKLTTVILAAILLVSCNEGTSTPVLTTAKESTFTTTEITTEATAETTTEATTTEPEEPVTDIVDYNEAVSMTFDVDSYVFWTLTKNNVNGDPVSIISSGAYGLEPSRKIFEYNDKGSLVKYAEYSNEGELGEKCEYDENGIITNHMIYIGGVIWKKYEYGENGNLVKELSYDQFGVLCTIIEYEYNESNKLTKKLQYRIDGSLQYWTDYEYDTNGNEIKNTLYESDGSIFWSYEYEYNEDGKKTKYTHKGKNGNSISEFSEYTYDLDGNLIRTETESYLYEFEYDDKGNRIIKTSYRRGGDLMDREEYEYDENGNMIKSTRYDPDGNITLQTETEYDKNGSMIKHIRKGQVENYLVEFDPAAGRIKYEVTATYEDGNFTLIYDTDGQLIEKTRATLAVARFVCSIPFVTDRR